MSQYKPEGKHGNLRQGKKHWQHETKIGATIGKEKKKNGVTAPISETSAVTV